MKKSIILCGLLAFTTSSFSSVKAKNRHYSTASLATQSLSQAEAQKGVINWGMVLRSAIAGIVVAVVGGGAYYISQNYFLDENNSNATTWLGYGLAIGIALIVPLIVNYVIFCILGPKLGEEDES